MDDRKAELRSATLMPRILQEAHAARHPAHATIVIGPVLAFCGGFVARKLRLPPLVGDENLSGQLAEIGVILLMFGIGLHFSLDDLLAVRWIALPGASSIYIKSAFF